MQHEDPHPINSRGKLFRVHFASIVKVVSSTKFFINVVWQKKKNCFSKLYPLFFIPFNIVETVSFSRDFTKFSAFMCPENSMP